MELSKIYLLSFFKCSVVVVLGAITREQQFETLDREHEGTAETIREIHPPHPKQQSFQHTHVDLVIDLCVVSLSSVKVDLRPLENYAQSFFQ